MVAEARGEVGGRRKGKTGCRPRDLGEADGGIGDGSEVGAEREEDCGCGLGFGLRMDGWMERWRVGRMDGRHVIDPCDN